MRAINLFRNLLFIILVLTASKAHGELSQKQARKLISGAAGLELPNKAVRVGEIRQVSSSVAETSAEIELVFRLTQNQQGSWRIVEIRSGQDKWEELELIARAAKAELPKADCDAPELFQPRSKSSDPSVKRARCLIAKLFAVRLPSDAVRVKEVSALALPLGSQPSATAVAIVQIEARFGTNEHQWRFVEFRSGDRGWLNLENLPTAVNQAKRAKASEELETIAHALEAFRRDRGFFIVSEKNSVLIDHLSPQYLSTIIRFDPWHKPYQYKGERDHFSLRSTGPDGVSNTADDIVVTDSSR